MRSDAPAENTHTADSVGLVIAWRRWRLRPDDTGRPQLGSAHENYVWERPVMEAECDPTRTWSFRLSSGEDEHRPPAAGCRCGVYAYRTPELARPMGPGVWVHGRVLIGGPMFLTDNGYRARQATIDGPLALIMECVGGDDLYSPSRCFGEAVAVKYDGQAYFPVCSSHGRAPAYRPTDGSWSVDEFIEAAAFVAASLETVLAIPAAL